MNFFFSDMPPFEIFLHKKLLRQQFFQPAEEFVFGMFNHAISDRVFKVGAEAEQAETVGHEEAAVADLIFTLVIDDVRPMDFGW